MGAEQRGDGLIVEQRTFSPPNLTIKELLNAIPLHCFKRSAMKSSFYVLLDVFAISGIFRLAAFLDKLLDPDHLYAYRFIRFALWSIYGFWAGLFATGLWVIAHECGHQAFSESKIISDSFGLILHTALGVPYFSWRISHAQHHASAGHMINDQVHVPPARSDLGLPPFDPSKQDLVGSQATKEAVEELQEAIGDSPISALFQALGYLLVGWVLYLTTNFHGQYHYPKGTNHFSPSSVIFRPHQFWQVIWSNVAITFWLAGLTAWACKRGLWEVLTIYGVPYLWVNNWVVTITFLQHTDPLLPHYRAPEFTFPRGALATFDRSLFGDCGKVMAWIGAHATHGISETHVVHHVSSRIPHYNAWEASTALKKFLSSRGIHVEGAPCGWTEALRVFRECRFVEDEGDVVFYKNAHGLAQMRPTSSYDDVKVEKESEPDDGIENWPVNHIGIYLLSFIVICTYCLYGIMLTVFAL